MELHDRLAALAHPQRLALLQLLLRRHPQAVAATALSEALALKANTLSNYLKTLRQAGLIRQERRGTSLLYSVDLDGLSGMMGSIQSGCCNNRPDLCVFTPPLAGVTQMQSPDHKYNVLFICTANSARSLMAEALLRHYGDNRFNAYSAGLDTSFGPHPEVIKFLAAEGINTAVLSSKPSHLFTETDAPLMDFVFTVCDKAANEECPSWPGQPLSAHWGQPDPVNVEGTDAEKHLAYQQAYDILKNRISAFAALPFDALDRMSLQAQIDEIGSMEH